MKRRFFLTECFEVIEILLGGFLGQHKLVKKKNVYFHKMFTSKINLVGIILIFCKFLIFK